MTRSHLIYLLIISFVLLAGVVELVSDAHCRDLGIGYSTEEFRACQGDFLFE